METSIRDMEECVHLLAFMEGGLHVYASWASVRGKGL